MSTGVGCIPPPPSPNRRPHRRFRWNGRITSWLDGLGAPDGGLGRVDLGASLDGLGGCSIRRSRFRRTVEGLKGAGTPFVGVGGQREAGAPSTDLASILLPEPKLARHTFCALETTE
jgi:hypothetical protein